MPTDHATNALYAGCHLPALCVFKTMELQRFSCCISHLQRACASDDP